ncbi:MAG: HEAT repeat domain-containing protein [Anaerolineae bacterium]|nr:HEAT repeat domain-containing protein [Anaerolineae bacterium]
MNRTTPNIWQLQAQRDITRLIAALDTPDASVRRRAVGALRVLEAREAVPRLRALLEREFHPQTRQVIEEALQHLTRDDVPTIELEPPPASKEVLLEQLNGNDLDVALRAMRRLSELDDRSVVESLVVVFRNPSRPAKLRLEAAEALLRLESAPASASLLGALRRGDWQIRRNAAAVLGQLEADWCVEPLSQAMQQDPHPVVRRTAAAALRRINTPEARAALGKADPPMVVGPAEEPPTDPSAVLGSPTPIPRRLLDHANLDGSAEGYDSLPPPAWLRPRRAPRRPEEDDR